MSDTATGGLAVPQIWNGKDGGEYLHVSHFPPLPGDDTWGNLTLKGPELIYRIEYINNRIRQTYESFKPVPSMPGMLDPASMYATQCRIEEVVYWLRVTADDLLWLLNRLSHGPEEVDAIWPWLKHQEKEQLPPSLKEFASVQQKFLDFLNNVSNAYKHSVLQTQVSDRVGTFEPWVVTANRHLNSATAEPEMNQAPLCSVVEGFSAFYQAGWVQLRALAPGPLPRTPP